MFMNNYFLNYWSLFTSNLFLYCPYFCLVLRNDRFMTTYYQFQVKYNDIQRTSLFKRSLLLCHIYHVYFGVQRWIVVSDKKLFCILLGKHLNFVWAPMAILFLWSIGCLSNCFTLEYKIEFICSTLIFRQLQSFS